MGTRKRSTRRRLWCLLVIGSLQVTVYLAPQNGSHLGGLLGCWVADECAIYVADEAQPEMAEAILLHEMVHAGNYAAGSRIGGTGSKDTDVSEEEEHAVNAISGVLYDALKRNGMVSFPERPS